MKDLILETQKIKINNKIIKPDDIRQLFLVISKEVEKLNMENLELLERSIKDKIGANHSKEFIDYQRSMLEDKSTSLLGIIAQDESTYESKAFDILGQGNVLDIKQINSIRYRFRDYNHDIIISIRLKHSKYDYENEITITGGDSIWVNGFLRKIEEVINGWEDQSTWVKDYNLLLMLFFTCCFAYVTGELILFVINLLESSPNNTDPKPLINIISIYLMFYFLMIAISWAPALIIKDKINSLWQSVELQTGKEYHQIEKNRRTKLWQLFSIVIIPTVLSIIIELAT